jgi:hypothetical protein
MNLHITVGRTRFLDFDFANTRIFDRRFSTVYMRRIRVHTFDEILGKGVVPIIDDAYRMRLL